MIINFSTLKLPLKKGQWCDADTRMFMACFAILGQFVEGELGKGRGYKGYRLHSIGGSDEKAIDLWKWYLKFKFKNRQDEEIADKKLGELIRLRRSLWT